MIQDCTLSSFISLLYNEVDAYDALSLLELLDTDKVLQKEYHGLEKAHKALSQLAMSPRPSTTAAILEYSRQ